MGQYGVKSFQEWQSYFLVVEFLKFIYSEKATKLLRNLPLTFDYSTYGQKISQNFVAFSEYMNFKRVHKNIVIVMLLEFKIMH